MAGLIGLLLASFAAFGAEKKQGYSIDVNFKFDRGGHKFETKRSFILAGETKSWTPLTDSKDGVALLGRLEPKAGNTYAMTFMVVDTNRKQTGLSQMQLIALYDQKAEIQSASGNESSAITLKASPTEYEEAP